MKNCVANWLPSALDVAEDPAKGMVALSFGLDDDYVQLHFPKGAIPPMFQQVLAGLRLTLPTAIQTEELTGGPIVPEGHDVQKLSDGRIAINLHLRTDDGMRTMSWGMPPEEAIKLADNLRTQAS